MRAIRTLAFALLLVTAGAALAEEGMVPAAPTAQELAVSSGCAKPSVRMSLADSKGAADSLDALFTPKPGARSSGGEECPPSGAICGYYGTGDCMPCVNEVTGQYGSYICVSWRCLPPYGAVFTCCSECERFAC